MIAPMYNLRAFALRLGALVALLVLGATLAMSNNILIVAIGILVIGAMFAHAVELQHQCLHYTAFRSRRTNKIVGILLGLPTLTSFHAYRRSHFEHHRNLGTPSDTPFFTYRFVGQPSNSAFIYDLFGISHIKASVLAIFGNGDSRLMTVPRGDEPSNISEQFDYALMGFLFVCACLISMAIGPAIVLKLWLLPFLFIAQPIHFLIELPEHISCDVDTTDVYRNTRTIVGSGFSRWFTNFNNFHVEHHLEPTLSMNLLPTIFEQVQTQHKHLATTYWQFYQYLYRSMRSQSIASGANNRARRHA